MVLNRDWICCLAVVLSACSGAAQEGAAPAPQTRGSAATPTLDGVRQQGLRAVRRDHRGRRILDAGCARRVARPGRRRLPRDRGRGARRREEGPVHTAHGGSALHGAPDRRGRRAVAHHHDHVPARRPARHRVPRDQLVRRHHASWCARRRTSSQSRISSGATICVQPGTTNEVDVADYFRKHKLTFTPVVIERLEDGANAYFAGRCDAFSQDHRRSQRCARGRRIRPITWSCPS